MMHTEMQPANRPTILIVEDDEDIRESLAAVLDCEGFTTLTAVNGRDALTVLAAQSILPSLILLDVMMPIMDGKEFLIVKEKDDRFALIPVVILTAGMHGDSAPSVVKLIKKPVELDDLLQVAGQYAGPQSSASLSMPMVAVTSALKSSLNGSYAGRQ